MFASHDADIGCVRTGRDVGPICTLVVLNTVGSPKRWIRPVKRSVSSCLQSVRKWYYPTRQKAAAQKTKQELGDQPRAKATVEICAGEAEVAWGRSCVTKRRAKWGTQYIRTRLLTRVFRGHNTRFPLPKNSAVGREKTFAGVSPKKI